MRNTLVKFAYIRPVTLDPDDLALLGCLYENKVIGSNHRRVDTIAHLCHIREKKSLKRRLRRLTAKGYLEEHHGPGYSLTKLGVQVAREYLRSPDS